MPEIVGRVVAINRFPVKSMAGEPLQEAEVDWQGLEGDRQYGFVKADDATRFPWFTGRDFSDLVRYRADYDGPVPRNARVTVTAPDGARWTVGEAGLRERLEQDGGHGLRLMQLGIGAYDSMPVSVVSTASFAALEAAHGSAVEPRRFRANIIVESAARELDWPARHVRFGGDREGGEDATELMLTYGAPRCAMITIDPDTGERDPRVLRTVAQAFGNAFVTYGSIARPGRVRVGDPVWA